MRALIRTGIYAHIHVHILRVTAFLLYLLFCICYLLDGWLSLQFIRVDIYMEANAILRYVVDVVGYPEIIYYLKMLALSVTGILFFKIESIRAGSSVMPSLLLLTVVTAANITSVKLLSEMVI
jgi:hypothetical protein